MLPRQTASDLLLRRQSERTVIASLLPYLLLLAVPTAVSAQPSLPLRATPVKDSLLVQVLNGGGMEELNKIGPAQRKKLANRLYTISPTRPSVAQKEGGCGYTGVLGVGA